MIDSPTPVGGHNNTSRLKCPKARDCTHANGWPIYTRNRKLRCRKQLTFSGKSLLSELTGTSVTQDYVGAIRTSFLCPDMGFDICHDGRLLELRTHTQPDGRIDKTLTISVAKPTSSLFDHGRYPPHFAGTIWHQSTWKFLQENANKGRAAGKENVNGRDCSVLEWDVAGVAGIRSVQ
jgi:hypothetical protein